MAVQARKHGIREWEAVHRAASMGATVRDAAAAAGVSRMSAWRLSRIESPGEGMWPDLEPEDLVAGGGRTMGYEDRCLIEAYLAAGLRPAEIGRRIGRAPLDRAPGAAQVPRRRLQRQGRPGRRLEAGAQAQAAQARGGAGPQGGGRPRPLAQVVAEADLAQAGGRAPRGGVDEREPRDDLPLDIHPGEGLPAAGGRRRGGAQAGRLRAQAQVEDAPAGPEEELGRELRDQPQARRGRRPRGAGPLGGRPGRELQRELPGHARRAQDQVLVARRLDGHSTKTVVDLLVEMAAAVPDGVAAGLLKTLTWDQGVEMADASASPRRPA